MKEFVLIVRGGPSTLICVLDSLGNVRILKVLETYGERYLLTKDQGSVVN